MGAPGPPGLPVSRLTAVDAGGALHGDGLGTGPEKPREQQLGQSDGVLQKKNT